MAIEKMKILGALLELPAEKHCQSSPFTSKLGQIGQIGSAVKLVAPKQLPGFWFFQLPWVPIIHFMWNPLLLCPHIFWVYFFSLSQCVKDMPVLIFSLVFIKKNLFLGVMLSHDNLTWTTRICMEQYNWHKERTLSYLPMSHVAGIFIGQSMSFNPYFILILFWSYPNISK